MGVLRRLNGWFYISCSKCYRELQGGFTSFTWASYNEAAGVQEPHDCDLPQCLEEIIGSTLTFQLNLPHFNFTAKHQSFTVSCILDHNQRPPQRNFEVHGGNDNPEDNMPGAGAIKKPHSIGLNSTL
ncbi:unnamed protein product [Brassica napus]|uniref:(rape) hypothetical protein n=1 Tax=Brassica napus TaxID=3708 RepID=A0A816L5J3_BRANA|nr:unnamed protein product [Brassica napus]